MNKYFKISDAKNFAFYKIPKALFEEKYKSVSTDAKMLWKMNTKLSKSDLYQRLK